MKINITNGEEFTKYISTQKTERFIPYNEAIIAGHPLYPLFADEFIFERCNTHNVSKDMYMSKKVQFLDVISNITPKDIIILWFEKDTFCQINLLSILTFLEQKKIKNKIYLNIIDESTKKIIERKVEIQLNNFTKSYKYLFKKISILKQISF